ncbi:MAG: alpha-glucan family phosphorylase [Phycisphaerales bacterium]|nr:alpha-glucan family phosphorylase [Phycisphaerales bacterium]
MTTRQTRQAGPARRGSTVGDWTTRIRALMQNLWWSWNPDPQRLFAALDPPAWEATQHNPLKTLAGLTPARRTALAAHREFQQLLTTCERQLRDYLRARTWFQRTADPRTRRLRIAYFCAEFAIHESMQQYAGGLGVLAGDHLKSASDLGVPLVAVGLLYRSGYYRQALRPDGTTDAHFPHYDFADWPVQDTGRRIRVPLGRRAVLVRIWQLQVGRVPVYLLDTDLPDNRPADRTITARLYGGDNETRIQQELILGVGGTRALQAGYPSTSSTLTKVTPPSAPWNASGRSAPPVRRTTAPSGPSPLPPCSPHTRRSPPDTTASPPSSSASTWAGCSTARGSIAKRCCASAARMSTIGAPPFA